MSYDPTSTPGTDAHVEMLRQLSDAEAVPARPGTGDEWSGIRVGDGTEPPGEEGSFTPRAVVRSFAFLDLCESTQYLEDMGAREALTLVSEFRSVVREVCARRGVRVAKWIGDGAMLVSVASGPVIAACVEICARMRTAPLPARSGVSVSVALPFDGDDYLARGANFAARMCDLANEGEVLCDIDCAGDIPAWVYTTATREIEVRGMGQHTVLVLDGDSTRPG